MLADDIRLHYYIMFYRIDITDDIVDYIITSCSKVF